MAIKLLLRQTTNLSLPAISPVSYFVRSFCSLVDAATVEESSNLTTNSSYPSSQMRFSSLLSSSRAPSDDFKIELVDRDSWHVSSGLSEAWKQMKGLKEQKCSIVEPITDTESTLTVDGSEFDIEDMRFHGKLFYKLDKGSREFEECNFELYGKKSSKKRKEEPKKSKEKTKKEKTNHNLGSKDKESLKFSKDKASLDDTDSFADGKKLRTPTFNQLTGPYHEPFCLDIFISNSSVRACIIHRVTSKVVAVAHSISKDMKFDLKSTKDENACATIGEVLAQRALADDIHDIVYTPRKGDKIEGKLQIVLQSVIDHGINVKVKLKQRNAKKVFYPAK